MAGKIKDCEKMTEGQLLRELVRRFIAYDKARDKYVAFLEDTLDHVSIFYDRNRKTLAGREFYIQKYGLDEKREKLHMAQDEKFCLCREIVRIVKKDPHAMWC